MVKIIPCFGGFVNRFCASGCDEFSLYLPFCVVWLWGGLCGAGGAGGFGVGERKGA